MQQENFDDLVLDYLNGRLSALARAEFERQLPDNPKLGRLLHDYRELLRMEDGIALESYPATTRLTHRVMDAIESRQQGRFFQVFEAIFAHRQLAVAGTLAIIIISTLVFLPGREFIIPPDRLPVTPGGEAGLVASFNPEIVPSLRDAPGGLAFRAEDHSDLAAMLNSMAKPFPRGAGAPVSFSNETAWLADKAGYLARLSFTTDKEIADLELWLRFDPDNVVSFVPIGTHNAETPADQNEFLYYKAPELTAGQQITAVLLLRVPNGTSTDSLLEGRLSYRADGRSYNLPVKTGVPQSVSIDLVSDGLSRVLSLLWPGEYQNRPDHKGIRDRLESLK